MAELTVAPDRSPADAPPAVIGRGLAPGSEVTVVIDVDDAAGNPWRSTTVIRVAGDGTFDTGRDLADPSRPWWDMAWADDRRVPVTFAAPADELDATVTLFAGGESGSWRCTRQWAGTLRIWTSSGDGYQLTVTFPDGDGPFPAVFVVPGAFGVDAVLPLAGLLAARGYVTGVVTYMEAELLPAALEEVPIEGLARAFADLASRPEVDPARIAVHASSVGTGGALLMLAADDAPAVQAVILVAPTSVVWQALPSRGAPPRHSSWTRAGTPLPWLPTDSGKLLRQLVQRGDRRPVASWAASDGPRPAPGLRCRPAAAAWASRHGDPGGARRRADVVAEWGGRRDVAELGDGFGDRGASGAARRPPGRPPRDRPLHPATGDPDDGGLERGAGLGRNSGGHSRWRDPCVERDPRFPRGPPAMIPDP